MKLYSTESGLVITTDKQSFLFASIHQHKFFTLIKMIEGDEASSEQTEALTDELAQYLIDSTINNAYNKLARQILTEFAPKKLVASDSVNSVKKIAENKAAFEKEKAAKARADAGKKVEKVKK